MVSIKASVFKEKSRGVLEAARKHQVTFGCAESCTGGLLSALITDIAGASEYFMGGIVSYSNPVKSALLHVSPKTLTIYGAVSSECAAEMAHGARAQLSVDLALSITGIAGPSGGTPCKPVGTVWMGLAFGTKTVATYSFLFQNNSREEVRALSALSALTLLESALNRR